MNRLILVSNRLPVNVKISDSVVEYRESLGGLATAMKSFYRGYDSVWVGWPGITPDDYPDDVIDDISEGLRDRRCEGVFFSKEDLEGYYDGFSNRTVWPLFHYFLTYTRMDAGDWESYKKVNRAFADKVLEIAIEKDTIWIHDYHLFLVPLMLREKLPSVNIGFFLHIPFPSSEVFRLLPWRNEILEGILGSDLIGFHTYDYVLHFTSSVRRLLGYESVLGWIKSDLRKVKVDAFPISIDYREFARSSSLKEVKREIEKIRKRAGDRKLVMSIDRLDYTKGIPNRIKAYMRFLEKYPQHMEKVTLIIVASPSRIEVDTYRDLKQEVERLVGEINGKYTSLGWVPVWYIFQNIPFKRLLALYCISDAALITPLRDGMNLIAKEYLACRSDNTGVLILSELAGASKELGEGLLVNPNNIEEMADSIHKALTMPVEKQVKSNRIMRERLKNYDVDRWANDFITDLEKASEVRRSSLAKKLSKKVRREILKDYGKADRRLLMLDYDGTLRSFKKKPEEAGPDDEIKAILKKLVESGKNRVVIVSGRDHETLERWFGDLELGIIGEHGVWIRNTNDEWRMIENLESGWKEIIRPVLQSYVIKTPGTFIEEKGYSLAWHYRNADPNQAKAQLSEMIETLHNLTSNLNVGILDGNKVIEIKNRGINKGRALEGWLEENWDFMLAIGDDWTDEDIFEAVGDRGYTIKVGFTNSAAKYHLKNVERVRRLLKDIIDYDEV